MADSSPSPFAKLPPELRQAIYHHIVASNSNEKIIKVALNDDQFRSESLKSAAGAIMVNKAMSKELLDYIFGMFAFSVSDIAPSSYSGMSQRNFRAGAKV